MRVNTLVIGAGRSGTTTVCDYLAAHPEICFSKIKEVHYFSIPDLFKRGQNYYHSFFPHFKNEKIVASADTYLMIDYEAIQRIKDYNPDMKIIVMLRNPVDRAYSSYNYSVNYGYHNALTNFTDCIKFEEGVENEPSVIQRNNKGHFYASLYYTHLSKWLEVFNKENFIFLKTSDLKNNPADFYMNLCNKLGIQANADFETNGNKKNANAAPKFKGFEQFLLNRENPIRRLIRVCTPGFLKKIIILSNVVDKIHDINRKQTNYQALPEVEREIANKYFKEDLKRLETEFGIGF